jgi:hypothetical protein
VIDEQVARDRKQPRANRGAVRVVAMPRLDGALERRLREVLGVRAGADTVGEEAVDVPDVFVVDPAEIWLARQCDPPDCLMRCRGFASPKPRGRSGAREL